MMEFFRKQPNPSALTLHPDSVFSRLLQFAKANSSLLINVVSAMLCILAADVAVQLLCDKRKAYQKQPNGEWSYNTWRSARLMLVAGILAAITHKWYGALDEIYATSSGKDVAAKIVLDQLIMAPIVITSYIFALGLLEGNKPGYVYYEWKEKFTKIYQVDLAVWPCVHAINLFIIPTPFRLVYINICTFLYNIYLTYVKHSVAVVQTEPAYYKVMLVPGVAAYVAADATAQMLHRRCGAVRGSKTDWRWPFDHKRLGRAAAIGLFLTCVNLVWYLALDTVYAAAGVRGVAAMVVLDAVIWSPVAITLRVFDIRLLEGDAIPNVYEEWKRIFTNLYITNFVTWSPMRVFILAAVPETCQKSYAVFYTYLWNVYLTSELMRRTTDAVEDESERDLQNSQQMPRANQVETEL